jgi:adenine deaminase
MTLSFMGLLVIPEIKLSDKGLFDVSKFELIDLFKAH